MVFFFSSRRRHTRWTGDWSSDVCSSDLSERLRGGPVPRPASHDDVDAVPPVVRGHDLRVLVEPVELPAGVRVLGEDEVQLDWIGERPLDRVAELRQAIA